MAEEKEVIVFEIDVSSYEKALKTQSDSIALLTQQQKELRKAAAEGNEAAAVSLEKVNAQLKVQQQEYRTTQSVLVGYYAQTKKAADTNNFFNNSISQNRALLKQLTAQYIDTVKPTKELTKQVESLSDVLKKQEAAIGDTRRNVGNYAGGIVDAFRQISFGGASLGSIIDPLKNIQNGFKAGGGSAAGFNAILLGGLPLIIAGLEGVVKVMQKFDSVTEGAEDAMSGLNRVFDDLIANGSKPFPGFAQLYEDLTNSYEAGVQLSQQLREIGEAEDRQRVNNAAASRDVEKLILQSKDRTKSEADRISLLDAASEKEKANLEENIKLAKERGAIAQSELKRVIEAGLNDESG